ncbi:MAG TPA: hypothetical protein VK139_03980 [Microbacteriaceae bacterium]|nr:hypothetical protein [Microbacteriaceae bacterium]
MRFRIAVIALAVGTSLTLTGCTPEVPNAAVGGIANRSDLSKLASGFDPGFIVSDQQFYDDHALSVDGVQSFLDRVRCTPVDDAPCLSDLRLDIPAIAAETSTPGHCAGIAAKTGARAAELIVAVARACGVSPKLLLVLMQKEQSLLTRPSRTGYERATGYGCPDTADCERRYFGIVNQLVNAAWQFRQYTVQPKRKYQVGTVEVPFHPNSACGSAAVTIRNQATANLYNYTPYQPNEAALRGPSGEGDGCSSWGNLNVWLLWNVWFGNPVAEPFPGYLSPCVTHQNGIRCPGTDPAFLFGGTSP